MKIRFDGDQQYQIDAVNAVLDVFDGQPAARGQFEVGLSAGFGGGMTELGFGNELALDGRAVLENVRAVQDRDEDIQPSQELRGMNFSVEMETGTGKTYVYLRTIHELYARYGFTKFIIVVPSVAIREGVVGNIELTRDHFRSLYGNHPFDYWVYDSKRVSSVRQFATSNQLQIMVINIDAFNKKANNVIHQENDRLSGYRPIEFIQQTAPIVVVDEPQNMESENAKSAIESLKPTCTLRYSATHRDPYNLLHRLTPVDAYEQRLVKRIEVDSVLDDPDFNRPFARLDSVKATKTKVTAKLTIDVQEKGGPRRKTVTVERGGVDLFDLSGERESYRDYIVDDIRYGDDARDRCVIFSNGERLCEGESIGENTDERMRLQVRETVKEHLEKELRVQRLSEERRLKVLSLFFIDRVANYAGDEPKIKRFFEEAYEELSRRPAYRELDLPPLREAHNGYFAQDKKGNVKDTSGKTQADDEAYELIMRDKERLLSPEEPLRFIFSHSALREGWDNPNVFQICTLNESRSEIRKRQEIGRGLRLPVDISGERCFDSNVNRLTVIANESYEDFARGLQDEFQQDGVPFRRDMVKPTRERRTARLKEGWREPAFEELWERIRRKTRYSVDFDTEALIELASEAVAREMPTVEPPKFRVQRGSVEIERTGVSGHMTSGVREERAGYETPDLPDVIGYVQRETELTRGTVAEILARSGRLEELPENPQRFMDLATRQIRETLQCLMIDNIHYRLSEEEEGYLLHSFERERQIYASRMLEVNKSIYDAIEFESDTEKEFARDLDRRDDVELFLKLPGWFEIDTPVGGYVPDWAIVRRSEDGERRLHLVAETKSSLDPRERRPRENEKIQCGEAHFGELPGVDYEVLTSASEV